MELNSLKIGSILSVTTISLKQYIGQFNGYMTVPASIFLKNARSHEAENCEFQAGIARTDLIYKDLMLECEDILKIEVVNEEVAAAMEVAEKKFEPSKDIEMKTETALTEFKCMNDGVLNTSSNTFKWIPGNQWKNFNLNHLTQKPKLEINQYCKDLFKNCNFVKLISPQTVEKDGNLEIGLPSYRAVFYRQPKIDLNSEAVGEVEQQLSCYGHESKSQELELVGVICKEVVEGVQMEQIVEEDLSFFDGLENLFKDISLDNEALQTDLHKLSTELIQSTLSTCKLHSNSNAVELNSPFLRVGNFTIYPGKLYLKSYEQSTASVNKTPQHIEGKMLNKIEVDT